MKSVLWAESKKGSAASKLHKSPEAEGQTHTEREQWIEWLRKFDEEQDQWEERLKKFDEELEQIREENRREGEWLQEEYLCRKRIRRKLLEKLVYKKYLARQDEIRQLNEKIALERAVGKDVYIEKPPLSKSLSVAEIMAICGEE